jgi:tRNA wybutosine-synthesizing protein 4
MANVLCQIRGSKRLLLFPPRDVQQLNFTPGASSSSIDAFKALGDRKMSGTTPHEVILKPGDVLYIPALWLHTAAPTEGVSVAVNVFFKSLHNGYAPGRDIYGNRDLQAYEKGRQDIARISRSFDNMPADVRQFYMLRLSDELKGSAERQLVR